MASETPTWDALADLERTAREARSREEEAGAERRRALRRVAETKAALASYQEAVYGGEREADEAEEAQLVEEITRAEAATSQAVTDARATAARKVREAAEAEVVRFASAHLAALVAEHAPEARAATEELEAAYAAREAASRRYATAQLRSFRLARIAGTDADDVPRHPLAGDVADVEHRFATGIEPPLPRSLAGVEEPT